MPTDVFLAQDSGSQTITAGAGENTKQLRYFVTGTDNEDTATAAIIAQLPNAISIGNGGLVLAESLSVENLGPESWVGTIDYTSPEKMNNEEVPKAIGEVTFSFDGTGGTTKIFHAFAQAKYGTGAPDYGDVIGVKPDGDGVDGVEIVVPQLSFTLSQKFAGATITLPWLRSIILQTGTVNSDVFLGFEAGEVLFLGPTGQQPIKFNNDGTVEAGEVDIEFRCAVSPNLTGLSFGDITGVDKKGHEYLWVAYEPLPDDTDKVVKRKEIGVYVAQVYRGTAFSGLGVSDPDTNTPIVGGAPTP